MASSVEPVGVRAEIPACAKTIVKFAEIFGQCPEEPPAVFGDGDVGAVAMSVRSKFGDGFIQRLLVATGNANLRAFRDKKPC